MSATTQGNHRMRVNDTVVVVTGASSGIGRATALAFANHGASLRQDLMLDGSRGIKVARVLPATIDNEPAPARGRSTATPTADGARPSGVPAPAEPWPGPSPPPRGADAGEPTGSLTA